MIEKMLFGLLMLAVVLEAFNYTKICSSPDRSHKCFLMVRNVSAFNSHWTSYCFEDINAISSAIDNSLESEELQELKKLYFWVNLKNMKKEDGMGTAINLNDYQVTYLPETEKHPYFTNTIWKCRKNHVLFPMTNKCFRSPPERRLPWISANRFCKQKLGGFLASFTIEEEYNFALDNALDGRKRINMYWMGMRANTKLRTKNNTHTAPKEYMRFVDHSRIHYMNWKKGKPDNGKHNPFAMDKNYSEDCVAFDTTPGSGNYWFDANCDVHAPFICSHKAISHISIRHAKKCRD